MTASFTTCVSLLQLLQNSKTSKLSKLKPLTYKILPCTCYDLEAVSWQSDGYFTVPAVRVNCIHSTVVGHLKSLQVTPEKIL